jgi:two-component sensor histidine kinase
MAHVQQQLGNYGQAVRYSLESIRKAQALGDTSHIQTFYLRLGWLYYELNEWDEGIVYMKKLMSIHQKLNQVGGVIATAEVITDGLIHQKKYPEALEYVKRTLRQIKTLEALQPPNPVSQVAFARMLARVYFHNGQYGEAEKYYTQYFQRLNQKITYPEEWAQAYADAGTFYVSTRNYPRAKDYLDKAMAIRQQLGNKTFVQIRNIYYQYFRLDSLQGNCKSALAHYQQYKILNDSIFNQTQGRQLANLRVQFDIRKKEQDLYLKDRNIQLLTKQTQLQQAHIRHSQSLRNMTLGGLALLLVLLGVIYNRYRLKQRSNQLLQTQQAVLQAQRLEIEQKNEHLSALLKQKERLLREIHHRVKNNLQVIMSLLNSQANSLQDHAALAAIRESQHRVHAMALIHQNLYQSEGVACISMPSYIGEVVAYLTEFYTLSSPVCFKLQVEEIELDVTQAVPLGLVINEALTNALKYAFPEGRTGTVKVGLIRSAKSAYRLTIADDGVGLSEGFDPATSGTLGMILMQGLSEQLGGRLTISSRSGLTIALLFGGQQPSSADMDIAFAD